MNADKKAFSAVSALSSCETGEKALLVFYGNTTASQKEDKDHRPPSHFFDEDSAIRKTNLAASRGLLAVDFKHNRRDH